MATKENIAPPPGIATKDNISQIPGNSVVMCDIHDINIYHDIIAHDTIRYEIILYRYTR